MSATGRGAERREHDAYYTPSWCVRRLLEAYDLPGGRWLDPAVGEGSIVRAVDDVRRDVVWTTVDIRPEVEPDLVADFVDRGCPALNVMQAQVGGWWDVAITNPPYLQALAYAKECLRRAPVVALLLRLNWLEGGEHTRARSDWLRAHTPDVGVLPDRPSFDGVGSDACAYAWMLWGLPGGGRVRILRATPREERARG